MQLNSQPVRVLVGLLMAGQALGHSWIEQLMVIAPNGTMVGEPGFPRGNSPRGPGFNEAQMVHLLPPGRTEVLPTDAMCAPTQQNFEPQPRSARLQASAGQAVALRYQENGHVSLPQNTPGKPQNGGTIFVYATTNPQPNEALMSIHRVWNAEGTGGDGRGRLLATSNFDDGQCYQINGQQISEQRQKQFQHAAVPPQGQDLWCQTDILLPSDLQAGKALTLYWVWDWPTMAGTPGLPQGKQEIYTTCMDIDIVPNANSQQGTLNAQSFSFVQQDIGNAAVPAQLKQLGNANAVQNPQLIPFNGQPAPGGSNGGSSKTSAPPPKSTAKQTSAAPSTTPAANNVAADSNPPPVAAPAPSPPQHGGQPGGNPPAASPPQQGGQPGGQQGGQPAAQPGPNLGPVIPIPGPGQQGPSSAGQGQGQGQRGGNNGNGQGRGGDDGSRPPGAGAPGVFAGGSTPEFGTGTGTAINGPGNQPNGGARGGPNAQGQQNPDPRPSTPATAPAAGQQVPDPRPATPATVTAQGAPVATVTQDAQVTVTQYVTVPAGQQGKRESESSFSTSAPSASESTTTTSETSTSTTETPTSQTDPPASTTLAGAGEPSASANADPLVVVPVKRQYDGHRSPPRPNNNTNAAGGRWHGGGAAPPPPPAHFNGTHPAFTGTRANSSRPVPTATAVPCSKTHPIYRLRARAPLYVLPDGADPAATDATAC